MPELTGNWLDPEKPVHTAYDCLQGRPQIRSNDVGRRWRCSVCNKVFQVYDTGSQRDPYWWKQVEPAEDVIQAPPRTPTPQEGGQWSRVGDTDYG